MLDALGKRLRRARLERERADAAANDDNAADETTADETAADETAADETAADETAADETAADETAQGDAPADAAPRIESARPTWDRAACPATLATALERLDDDQLRAVLAEGDVAVCAAVGSGKTTVLVHRVVWLHLALGVPLERIAVVTFTRKAAAEIAARLRAWTDAAQTPGATWLFGTFHAVARSLLAGALPVAELGFSREFRILDASERDALWRDLIARHDLVIKHARQLERRMAGLAEGQTRYGQMRRDDDLVRLAELYEDEKRALDAMDYDDLLHGAAALCGQLPAAQRPLHIVVDELQDCDEDQLDLVEALRGGLDDAQATVFAVGDPHQTIYGWRGGGGDIFDRFASRFAARRLALPRNYRSSATLVHAAQGLLVGGAAILAPEAADLRPTRPDGPRIDILRHHDALAEAAWIADELAEKVAARGSTTGLAVLARTRKQLEPVAAALARRGLRVERAVTRNEDEELARWLHALLRAGLRDDLAALRIALADVDRGLVLPGQLGDASLPAAPEATTMPALERVATRIAALGRRSKRLDSGRAEATLAALRSMRVMLGDASAGDTATRLALHLDLAGLLRPTRARAAAETALASDLLVAWCRRAEALAAGAGHEPLADCLVQALEEARIDRDWLLDPARASSARPGDGGGDGLALTTIHAAKGLEWDEVWLVGCNDGVLPVSGAMTSPSVLAEEQRLLFVAITRARDALHVGWLGAPDQPRAQPEPSPLLRLLPASTVSWLQEPPRKAATAAVWPAVGDAVQHPSHGDGVVVTVDNATIEVAFRRSGTKRLARAFANLRPPQA